MIFNISALFLGVFPDNISLAFPLATLYFHRHFRIFLFLGGVIFLNEFPEIFAFANMGSLLPKEHVLLVGVQHMSGMWVLRGMRMGAYVTALKVEAHEVGRCGSLKQALQDAQQLAAGFRDGGAAAAKARRKGSAEASVVEWARGMEQEIVASGWLWAVQANGTRGLGLPQHQFVAGGDFPTALPVAARRRLEEVRRELRGVREELEMLAPTDHGVPPSVRQWAGGPGAVLLSSGNTSGASLPVGGPMLNTRDLSLYPPLAVDPLRCMSGGAAQTAPMLASVVPLADLSAGPLLPRMVKVVQMRSGG